MFVFHTGASKNEIHFGLLHLLDVFKVGSQHCQSPTMTEFGRDPRFS